MAYYDLREFLKDLEKRNQLVRVQAPVDINLEITEILNRLLRQSGPTVIFENVRGYDIPVVANLFGTVERVALGLGTDESGLIKIGEMLASLQRPKPPQGILGAIKEIPRYKQLLAVNPKTVSTGACQEVILTGEQINLLKFPILKCWPEDGGQLITWPLVITQGPNGGAINVGVYRMQVLSEGKTTVRWLRHRGGAQHHREWQATGQPMPVAVTIGNEPAMIVAATTPLPENLSEFDFAGLLRKKAVELVQCKTINLKVPASSEIVLEGEIYPDDLAPEGPFGDHTGYYNPPEPFPVFHIKCITHRRNHFYLTTVTGRPPREDAALALALNRIFLPLLRQAFPEVVDFALPMEAVSYRIAIVSIKKQYPGHAKQIMMGLWGYLKQFLCLKYIIVVDPDIDVNDWEDVIWALATRVDPARDSTMIKDTSIDYLDFASARPELGSKMGIDATMKSPPEVDRPWSKKIVMDPEIVRRVEERWQELGLE